MQIQYTSTDKLRERLDDLLVSKDILVEKLNTLMDRDVLSKKGFKRVLTALGEFPKPPAKKLNDENEIAIFTISTKLRETQLLMTMIVNELSNMESIKGEHDVEA